MPNPSGVLELRANRSLRESDRAWVYEDPAVLRLITDHVANAAVSANWRGEILQDRIRTMVSSSSEVRENSRTQPSRVALLARDSRRAEHWSIDIEVPAPIARTR
jgi:hypothetical protein